MSKSTMVMGVVVTVLAASFGSGCKAGATCAEGASKNAETGICIKTTGDYKLDEKATKVGTSSSISVRNTKTFHGPSIWIEKPDDITKRSAAVAGMAGGDLKLVASGDTVNKGKFFHFHNTKGNYEFAVALIPGKEHFYRCEIQNGTPAETPEQLEMCKTLSGP